jgi:AraC-like DNA-binding protein
MAKRRGHSHSPMSDLSDVGVLYTEHVDLRATTPALSLWSYESCVRGAGRRPVARNRDHNPEYWLERSDPLLNTFLPGTGVSVVVNFGDPWAAGRSLTTSALLPRVCVIGPVTHARIARVGRHVDAIGVVFPPTQTFGLFGVPAPELLDRIVPLDDLWTSLEVEQLYASWVGRPIRARISAVMAAFMTRIGHAGSPEPIAAMAARAINRRGGRIAIDAVARSHGLSRQEFARRFAAGAGLTPKVFARITRFQSLVRALLSSDVSQWAGMAPDVGFYDQAHMINEFRTFAGAPPTVFFQPHGGDRVLSHTQLQGRPSEWT